MAILSALTLIGVQDPPDRVQAWLQDLDELSKGLAEKHKNAFFKIKREEFVRAAAELRRRIPTLKDHQVAVEFMKLAALIGDGHTSVAPTITSPVQLRRYPIATMWLKDGLYIVATDARRKELLKARVLAVGKLPVEEAAGRMAEISAADNESGARNASAHWLMSPEVLVTLGIIEDMERPQFRIVDAQRRERTVDLPPGGPFEKVFGFDKPDKESPISRRLARPRYGVELFADTRTLYAWYDACSDLKDRPVAAWCEETLKRLDDDKPDRIILDLRRNSGGNSVLIRPLLAGLKKRPEATARGKLFVLTDRRTFSSALMNAVDFRREFQAIVVGLPPGGGLNQYGEVRNSTLTHCKWQVWYSTERFKLTDDGGDTLVPDVEADWTAEEFFGGRDPALESAIKHR